MKKIIFLGDSITDADHLLRVSDKCLGHGYVQIINQKLEKQGEKVKMCNRGHDGYTVHKILRTLERDCILDKPSIVSILVGCNDVGVMMNTRKSLKEQCFMDNYDKLLAAILDRTEAKIICMGPFIFPYPEKYQTWIPGIKQVEKMIKAVAQKHYVPFIPLQEEMQKAAEEYGYKALTVDGIHLTKKGEEIIADKWINVWKTME